MQAHQEEARGTGAHRHCRHQRRRQHAAQFLQIAFLSPPARRPQLQPAAGAHPRILQVLQAAPQAARRAGTGHHRRDFHGAGGHHRCRRPHPARVQPQPAPAFRRQTIAAGRRRVPTGTGGESRRDSRALRLLPFPLLLLSTGFHPDRTGVHRVAEGVPANRPGFHQRARPYTQQHHRSRRPATIEHALQRAGQPGRQRPLHHPCHPPRQRGLHQQPQAGRTARRGGHVPRQSDRRIPGQQPAHLARPDLETGRTDYLRKKRL